MKKITLTCLLMMFMGALFAQHEGSYYYPLWNEYLHGPNADICCYLYIDDVLQTGTNWEIGAYNVQDGIAAGHDVVCGKGQPIVTTVVPYPYYPVVYKGETNDDIFFRVYDHSTNQEMDYVTPLHINFVADESLGSLAGDPYEMRFYTPIEMMVFDGSEDDSWSNVNNWKTNTGQDAGRTPKAIDNVTINADCTLDVNATTITVTIASGASLTIEEEKTLTAELTIKDGGQLFAPDGMAITATVEKAIAGYTNNTNNEGNWYLLSMPVQDFTNFNGAGMLANNYDLYMFDQEGYGENTPESYDEEENPFPAANGEWRNYKYYVAGGVDSEGDAYSVTDFEAECGGYLYANSDDVTLSFTGDLVTDESTVINLNYVGDADEISKGFNLVGNPYPSNAVVTAKGSKVSSDYYIMNAGPGQLRKDLIVISNPVIAPATAFFAYVTGSGKQSTRTLTLEPSDSDATVRNMVTPCINIEVLSSNGVLEDRAYVNAEEDNLVKFSLRRGGTKIFFPQNGKNYAAAYKGEANMMPLCFTSTEGGIHTITVKPENMDCSYLHLIDNVTGTDVDLLRTPKYSFNANDGHYATRFKLVFSEEGTNEIIDNFAFVNNGDLVINNYGEATLQVMDITGRILSTENISDSYTKSINSLCSGVYVVRLVNGSDVKAQKIVVE